MGDANTPTPGRNWAVALVHGIGTTAPVEMMRLVTRAVGHVRPALTLEDHARIHPPRKWRPGDLEPGEVLSDQHVHHATIGSSKVRFAAAHWSNVAFVGDSFINLIGSIALGGLGVRYFADVGTTGNSWLAKVLHWLLLLMIWLLAVIFLPLAICSLIVGAMALLAFHLFYGGTFAVQIPFIALGSLAGCYLINRYALAQLRDISKERRLVRPIFQTLLALGVGIALLLILDHPRGLGQPTGAEFGPVADWIRDLLRGYGGQSGNRHLEARVELLDETSVYLALLQLLQTMCGFLVICLSAAVLVVLAINVLRWRDRAAKRSLFVGAVSVVTMWLLMLFVMWPENLVTTWATQLYVKDKAELPKGLQAWSFNLTSQVFEQVNITGKTIANYYPLLWFDIFFFVFLIATFVSAVIIWLFRSMWSRRHRSLGHAGLDGFRPGKNGRRRPPEARPRLVMATSYQALVLLFMLTITTTAFAHWNKWDKPIVEFLLGRPLKGDIPHEIALLTLNVAFGVTLAIVLFVVLAHVIKQAVKLILDVVNHFASPAMGFPIRRRIAARLKETLAFLLKENDQPHLVVICHSQGTVITFDTLFGYYDRQGVWQKGLWETDLAERVASLTVLSFGSPITHIYQHYFSHIYQPFEKLDALKQAKASKRVRWFNSYRIDDYIGTYIDPSLGDFPVNVPMPTGGHTSYWIKWGKNGEEIYDVFERLFAEPGMETVLTEVGVSAAQAA